MIEALHIVATLKEDKLNWTATTTFTLPRDFEAFPLFTLDENTTLISHTIPPHYLRLDEVLLNQIGQSLSLQLRPADAPLAAGSPLSADADEEGVPNVQVVLQLSTNLNPLDEKVTLAIPRALRNSIIYESLVFPPIASPDDPPLHSIIFTNPPLSNNDNSRNLGLFATSDTLSISWASVCDAHLAVVSHSMEVDYTLDREQVRVIGMGRVGEVVLLGQYEGQHWIDMVITTAQVDGLKITGPTISHVEINPSPPPLSTRPSTRSSSRTTSPNKLPPSPSPLRLYPKPSSLLHEFQIRPPLRYSSQPESYSSLFDTVAPPTPGGEDDVSLLKQEAPFARESPTKSATGSGGLEGVIEDQEDASSRLRSVLSGGNGHRSETRIRIHIAPEGFDTQPDGRLAFDYTVEFCIPTHAIAATQDQDRQSFRIPSLSIPAAVTEIITTSFGVGQDESVEVESELSLVMESVVNENDDWSVSPLPSTGSRVKWSRSRSHVAGEGGRDMQVELKLPLDGDSTMIAEDPTPESPSPRRTRTDSLPSLPPPLARFDTTITVPETPYPIAIPSLFDVLPLTRPEDVCEPDSTAEEVVPIGTMAARSISASDSLFSNIVPPQPAPISSTPPPQLEESMSSAPSIESLLPPLATEVRSITTIRPTTLRSARLTISRSEISPIPETGYELLLSHQLPLAEHERRIEFTIEKRLQLNITAWDSSSEQVPLEVSHGDGKLGQRVVVVTWTEMVKEFVFSVALVENDRRTASETRYIEKYGALESGVRSMRLGFAVAVLEVDIIPSQYHCTSFLSPIARQRAEMTSPAAQIDIDGLRHFHLSRLAPISLVIARNPDPPAGIARSFDNAWQKFTLRNVLLSLFALLFLANWIIGSQSKHTVGRKCARNITSSNLSNSSTSQILTVVPLRSPVVSSIASPVTKIETPTNELVATKNGEFTKLTKIVQQTAVQLVEGGRRTLVDLLVWLGLRVG